MNMELGFYTFGDIHPDPNTGIGITPGQAIRDVLERTRLAEEVGLDYVGIGEHHREDYSISSPSTVISAALAQTERIHVGSAVTVLSTEDPVRVYQQFSTMDQFSNGRVELLAGRGSFIESYPLFGAELGDYDALYDEKIQLLLALDSGEPVTWSGKFRAPLEDVVVLPRPADIPGRGAHLNIAVATGGNSRSSVRAGMLGLPVNYAIIGGEPAQFAPLAQLYRQAHEQAGHPAEKRTVTVSAMGFVAEENARDFWFPYWYESMRVISAERGFPAPSRMSFEQTAGPRGAYFVGNPDEVAAKIVHVHEAIGNDRLILQMDLSGVPQKESLKAIELLGTEVKPRIERALAK
ncbi:LLM class flavin-dependent oxidoreductase [Lysinibacter cavernae]|uniref:Putative LLM family oxidoreductase n=1 Tax=Lysinibacter cavernae TaxID=1640652 RepID=A0A7X5QZ79_9MICO|nr:LLM class flavin-dependent oxidoreductase [Lysinibacter cavernae]NIH52502.1 putative LLM family oxidoreductase [Lysinibacter cavernae]